MTTVRLVMIGRSGEDLTGAFVPPPATLVSYWYLDRVIREGWRSCRDWALDSGAYSANSSGTPVDRDEYHARARDLLDRDPSLAEVFALDVIGDWRATLRNTELAWEVGIPAIPTFHLSEPEHVLVHIAKTYPKIALGGVAVRGAPRYEWAKQCFARVWPKAIHGFGFGDERSIMGLPFHSADASSWCLGPTAFSVWKRYGGRLHVPEEHRDIRPQIRSFLDLETRAQHRWRKQMKEVTELMSETAP